MMGRTKGKHFLEIERNDGVIIASLLLFIVLVVVIGGYFILQDNILSIAADEVVETTADSDNCIITDKKSTVDAAEKETEVVATFDEVVEKPLEEEKTAQAISYTDEEFSLFCALLYAEAGGEKKDCKIATAWAIRNRIEKNNNDFQETIFYPYAYTPADPVNRVIRNSQGKITDEMIPSDVKETARGVLDGTIPSPIEDWGCFLGYTCFGYEDGNEFASIHNIKDYKVIDNAIFFSEDNWTEELNNIICR